MSAYIDSQRTTVEKIGNLFIESQSNLPNYQLNYFNPLDGEGFSELYDFGKLCVGKGRYWLSHSSEMSAEAPIQSFGITILLTGTHHFYNYFTQQEYVIKSPALILRRGNIGKQTIYLQPKVDMSLITLDFDHNLLNALNSATLHNTFMTFYTESSIPAIQTIPLESHELILHQSHYLLNLPTAQSHIHLLHLEGAALELLSLILHLENDLAHTPPFIQKTIEILEKNFNQKITIRALARQVGINECDLKKVFKQYTQLTIGNYLLNVRMRHAQLLLKDGKNFQNVSNAVGYDNPQYFKKVFKQYFNYNF